jgi:hypothetical protein
MLVKCDICLWAERNLFLEPFLIWQVKTLYELKHIEIDSAEHASKKTGTAASAKTFGVKRDTSCQIKYSPHFSSNRNKIILKLGAIFIVVVITTF